MNNDNKTTMMMLIETWLPEDVAGPLDKNRGAKIDDVFDMAEKADYVVGVSHDGQINIVFRLDSKGTLRSMKNNSMGRWDFKEFDDFIKSGKWKLASSNDFRYSVGKLYPINKNLR